MSAANPPRITVVTPSFNQAQFLETTIRSVLGQRYPALEYMILDGGSTDGSVEIIRRHERELAFWISEPDGGQANAINRAFARASGDILCWLNSDDFHFPDTLWRVAEQLGPRIGDAAILLGSCLIFEQDGTRGRLEPPAPHDPERLRRCDPIIQPSTFWTAAAWRKAGPLDGAMHFAFDWDWFLRAAAVGCKFIATPAPLAAYRIHAAHKSSSGGERRRNEILATMRRHAPPQIVAMYEWLRARPHLWPALRRWRHLQRIGVPAPLAALICPRLLALPRGFSFEALADCFDML